MSNDILKLRHWSSKQSFELQHNDVKVCRYVFSRNTIVPLKNVQVLSRKDLIKSGKKRPLEQNPLLSSSRAKELASYMVQNHGKCPYVWTNVLRWKSYFSIKSYMRNSLAVMPTFQSQIFPCYQMALQPITDTPQRSANMSDIKGWRKRVDIYARSLPHFNCQFSPFKLPNFHQAKL